MKTRSPVLVLLLVSAAAAALLLVARSRRDGGGTAAARPAFSRDAVAVVEVTGVITSEHNAGTQVASARRIVEQLEKHASDRSVRAVVLRVDSPGGSVVASQEVHAAVGRLRARGTKVVASLGDVAASGGYYVACAADRVLASPGTLTGSIGVVMQFPDLQGLFGKIGVGARTITSGEFKDIGNSLRDMTPRERELLQALVDDVHGQFVDAVAAGRRMPPAQVRGIADGRVFTGRRAQELGLVDALGDLDAAILEAGRLAGIEGRPRVLRSKGRRGILELLDARLGALTGAAPLLLDASAGRARLLYLWQ